MKTRHRRRCCALAVPRARPALSFTPQGSLRYSLRLGSTDSDGLTDIAARPAGGWLMAFYVQQPITLGDQSVSAGEHLLWVDEH